MRVLRSSDYLRPGEAWHFARTALPEGQTSRAHRQDFFEVFWLESGAAEHICAAPHPVDPGDVVFVRPDDRHAFHALRPGTILANLLVTRALADRMRERYPELDGRFFYHNGPAPLRYPTPANRRRTLRRAASTLATGARTALRGDGVLLLLFTMLIDLASDLPDATPPWLARAAAALQDPAVLRRGVPAFVAVAGRSAAHVSRACRTHLGLTPTALVNRIRMTHAADLLETTALPLAEIAERCGTPTPSHFYKLFTDIHGIPPRRFRQDRARQAVLPD